MTVRRPGVLLVWTAAAVVLLACMFPAFETTPLDVVVRLARAPLSMYLLVLALTLANQLAGAQKWRLVMQHVAGRDARPSLAHAFGTTAIGTLFGQLVPVQVSTAVVRASSVTGTGAGARAAVGTTIYEQLYDFVILLPAAGVGVATLLLRVPPTLAVGVMLAAVSATVLVTPYAFDALAVLSSRLHGTVRGRLGRGLERMHEAVFGAAAMPRPIALRLALLSVARAACMAGRVVVIAAVLAPGAQSAALVQGFPAVGIVGALPLTPAGLGVVEWSWSGLLVFAGATPAAAAACAISIRLVNLAVVGVILACLGLWRTGLAAASLRNG